MQRCRVAEMQRYSRGEEEERGSELLRRCRVAEVQRCRGAEVHRCTCADVRRRGGAEGAEVQRC